VAFREKSLETSEPEIVLIRNCFQHNLDGDVIGSLALLASSFFVSSSFFSSAFTIV
jgi:hypothetical protein